MLICLKVHKCLYKSTQLFCFTVKQFVFSIWWNASLSIKMFGLSKQVKLKKSLSAWQSSKQILYTCSASTIPKITKQCWLVGGSVLRNNFVFVVYFPSFLFSVTLYFSETIYMCLDNVYNAVFMHIALSLWIIYAWVFHFIFYCIFPFFYRMQISLQEWPMRTSLSLWHLF